MVKFHFNQPKPSRKQSANCSFKIQFLIKKQTYNYYGEMRNIKALRAQVFSIVSQVLCNQFNIFSMAYVRVPASKSISIFLLYPPKSNNSNIGHCIKLLRLIFQVQVFILNVKETLRLFKGKSILYDFKNFSLQIKQSVSIRSIFRQNNIAF